MSTVHRPKDEGDWNMAFLFPDEIAEARKRTGLVILPLAPLEWHGPHLAMGCDPLLAHAFAKKLAQKLSCPYFPPLFVGTERERKPETLKAIGLESGDFVEGMDFPSNSVGSAYFREETFALVVRDALNILFTRFGFSAVLIVNGHGADNQRSVLDRICIEMNAAGRRLMWVYPGFPHSLVAGAIGHATAEEASMLAATWPACVDLKRLPLNGPLRNAEHAIVDGDTFDGQPTPDFTVREEKDPRRHTDADLGRRLIEEAAEEAIEEIKRRRLIK